MDLKLDLDAYIPASYIPNEYQKLDIYKRIAALRAGKKWKIWQKN